MFARCSPIAGPSRITAHRTIYITCMRLAVPPNRPLPLPPKPGSNKPRPRPPVASPSTPPKPPATPAPPFSSPIPSKPSHSSKFPFYIIPSDIPGMIAEERVVFARPPDLFGGKPDNIRMIWAGSFFVAIVLVNMSMTILPEEKHQAEGPAKAKGIIEKMVDNRIVVNTGLGLLLFSAVFGVTLIQHRYILRLTQVRYRQAPATGTSGEARNVIRMTTAMHRSKVPGIKGPVEYPLEEVKVRMIDRRAAQINLDTKERKRFRLNYAESSALEKSKEEVVLSLNRLEEVFGKLAEPRDRPKSLIERMAGRLAKNPDKQNAENKGPRKAA